MNAIAENAYPTPLMNSTLLPMLLLSLTSQKHTPDTTDKIDEEYDYIIVGAGTAGSVVASRLSEMSCLKILLLEAGDAPPLLTDVPALAEYFKGTDIDWNFKTVPQKHTGDGLTNRQLVYPSGKAIGGSSVLNGMLYIRGNSKDYDKWAAEGAKGWSYKDVFPFFKKMEGNRDKNYIANDGPMTVHRSRYQSELMDPLMKTIKSMGYKVVDPNSGRQTGFYDVQSTLRAGQRCSTAKAYLVPAENRTNLDILPNAMVRKVLIKNNRAVGVQFDYQNFTYEVKAKMEVILSAGTIKTAQLLKLSGIGPRKELEKFQIPVVADLPVGLNLQDHPVFHTNFLLGRNVPRITEKLTDGDNLAQYIRNRTGPLSSTDFASAVAFLKGKVVVPKQDYPDYQLTFSESQYEFPLKTGLTPKYLSQVYGPYKGRSFYVCKSSLLHPKSRGTVMLQSVDPYDSPLIDPNYFEDLKDVQGIIEGIKMCLRIGKNPLMRNVGSVPFQTLVPGCEKHAENEELYLECAVRSTVFTFGHAVGTARMGDPNDPNTVVDPQLKVLHIGNLRVVDASVMPTITSGNTNIPTIMVAEKASDIIKSTIECLDERKDLKKKPVNPKRSGSILENSSQPYTKQKNKHEPLSQEASISRSTKPRFFPAHSPKDVHDLHDEDHWEDKTPIIKKQKGFPKVTPWNKEIPYVVPWNQEIMKVNLLNIGGNQTPPGNLISLVSGNQPVIPGLPPPANILGFGNQQMIPGIPGLPRNAASALPTNTGNNQQITPSLPQPQASLTSEHPRIPAILPQSQAPNDLLQTQIQNNPLQVQTPVNSLISQLTGFAAQTSGIPTEGQAQILINLLQAQTPLSNLQLQNLMNTLQAQTPVNSLQYQLPSNGLVAQTPDNSVSSRSPVNASQIQPDTLVQIGRKFTDTQAPVDTRQIKEKIDEILQQLLNPSNQLRSSGNLEYSPFQNTQLNIPYKNEKNNPLINLSSGDSWKSPITHIHKHVVPWNKEVPNVVPWNQELLSSKTIQPSISNQQVPQTLPNNPAQGLPTNPLTNQQSQIANVVNSPRPQAPVTPQQTQAAQPSQPQGGLPSQTGNAQDVMQYLTQLQQTLQSQISSLTSRQQLMQNVLEIVQQMNNLFSPGSPLTPPNRRAVENSKALEHKNGRPCDKEICDALLKNMRCTHVSCQDKKALSVFMHSRLCL